MGAVRSGDRTVWCAEREGELVGIAAMGPSCEAGVGVATAGRFCRIHVRPGMWGQGIGSCPRAAFVRFLRDVLLAAGVLEVWGRNG
jgi:GNAT superfamily N-acetyltransferase